MFIELTQPNGKKFYMNADKIYSFGEEEGIVPEGGQLTIMHISDDRVNGAYIRVKETPEEILIKIYSA